MSKKTFVGVCAVLIKKKRLLIRELDRKVIKTNTYIKNDS
jgi:hypothetical protein